MSSKRVRVTFRQKRPFRDGFATGWRAGGALGEALGALATGLRALLSPPARSRSIPRDAEKHETAALLAQVEELWAASPLGEIEPTGIAGVILSHVIDRVGFSPSEPVLDALVDAIISFMISEGLWEVPPQAVIQELSLEDGVELRAHLRHQRAFLSDFDEAFENWADHLVATLATILEALPEHLIEADGEGGGQRLQSNLIDLATDSAELVEKLSLCFSSDELITRDLFRDVRKQLYLNLLAASGIEPDKVDSTTKRAILPSAVRGASPTALVSDYLRGTPYNAFLRTKLGFAVPTEARFEHTHILGGTGHGKTQLLKLLAYDDISASLNDHRSIIVLDSQGDLVNTLGHLKEFAPGNPLSDRLLLVDPTDTEYPVCLNLFSMRGDRADVFGLAREQLFNGTVALYEYMFGALLGAELTQRQGVIFKYLARLMMVIPRANIHTFRELMQDAQPYRQYVERLDGTARAFFETQFFSKSYDPTKKQILTRLWGILSNQTFDRMFSHTENKVDLSEAMNSGKIVLINTAKDLLQADGCSIFGRFFVALITQAALARASIPEKERRPCFVYIDEAHEYFDDHTEDLLNQARKYRVGMILAHQNLDQLGLKLRATVMASTSIKLAGGVSSKDATALAREMNAEPDAIVGVRKRKKETQFACYVKNLTPGPITVTVPLGAIDAKPAQSKVEYGELVSQSRRRVALPLTGAPLPSERRAPPHLPQEAPPKAAGTASEIPELDSSPPNESVGLEAKPVAPRLPSAPGVPPPAMGRGGKQHKYLQGLIKQLAEGQGFRATIEESIDNGAGRIDVSLLKGDTLIACEISVTTSPEHELQNVQKCLGAGYERIILVTPGEKELGRLRTLIESTLSVDELEKVACLLPEQCGEYLEQVSPSDSTTQTVRGYKVRLSYQALSATEQQRRRDTIGKVIAGSMKRLD